MFVFVNLTEEGNVVYLYLTLSPRGGLVSMTWSNTGSYSFCFKTGFWVPSEARIHGRGASILAPWIALHLGGVKGFLTFPTILERICMRNYR